MIKTILLNLVNLVASLQTVIFTTLENLATANPATVELILGIVNFSS